MAEGCVGGGPVKAQAMAASLGSKEGLHWWVLPAQRPKGRVLHRGGGAFPKRPAALHQQDQRAELLAQEQPLQHRRASPRERLAGPAAFEPWVGFEQRHPCEADCPARQKESPHCPGHAARPCPPWDLGQGGLGTGASSAQEPRVTRRTPPPPPPHQCREMPSSLHRRSRAENGPTESAFSMALHCSTNQPSGRGTTAHATEGSHRQGGVSASATQRPGLSLALCRIWALGDFSFSHKEPVSDTPTPPHPTPAREPPRWWP